MKELSEDNTTVYSSDADTLSQHDNSEQEYSLDKLMSAYDDFKFIQGDHDNSYVSTKLDYKLKT